MFYTNAPLYYVIRTVPVLFSFAVNEELLKLGFDGWNSAMTKLIRQFAQNFLSTNVNLSVMCVLKYINSVTGEKVSCS